MENLVHRGLQAWDEENMGFCAYIHTPLFKNFEKESLVVNPMADHFFGVQLGDCTWRVVIITWHVNDVKLGGKCRYDIIGQVCYQKKATNFEYWYKAISNLQLTYGLTKAGLIQSFQRIGRHVGRHIGQLLANNSPTALCVQFPEVS